MMKKIHSSAAVESLVSQAVRDTELRVKAEVESREATRRDSDVAAAREASAREERERIVAILEITSEKSKHPLVRPSEAAEAFRPTLLEMCADPSCTVETARQRFADFSGSLDRKRRAAGIEALKRDEAELDAPPVSSPEQGGDMARSIKLAGDYVERLGALGPAPHAKQNDPDGRLSVPEMVDHLRERAGL